VQVLGDVTLRHATRDHFADPISILFAFLIWNRRLSFRASKNHPFGLFASKSFFSALAYKVSLNLGGKAKCKRKNLTLNIVTKAIAIFNCPYTTFLVHAGIQNFHNHEQAASEA
jgi:putative flippase GtrA